MQEYSYKAIDNSGETVVGNINAESYHQVVNYLQNNGLEPFYLEKAEQKTGEENTTRGKYNFSIGRHNDLLIFTKQLANLLQAGIKLDQALAIIIKLFKESNFKNVIIAVDRYLKEGKDFAASLEKYPSYFNSTYISMIRAGEESGYLPLICRRIAGNLEESQQLRSFIISSLIYPIVLIVVSVLAVITILVFVLPKFISIYDTYDKSLPLPTIILLNTSGFIKQYGLIILFALLILIPLLWYYAKTATGKRKLDALQFKIPFYGELNKKLAVSRITSSLGVLIDNGVSLIKSLKIIKEITGNTVYSQALKAATIKVERGVTLSRAIKDTAVFPDITVYYLGVGEETGELGAMLRQLGEDMTAEYKESLARFLKLFEPVVLLIMGLLIGFIVFAILLPVMRISTLI